MSHLSLVSKGIAAHQTAAHLLFLNDVVNGVHLGDAFLTETNVEHAELSDEGLILSKEERELGLLQGQRQRGTNDVRAYIISIIFRHQTGRHVEAHHLGRRAVDILH